MLEKLIIGVGVVVLTSCLHAFALGAALARFASLKAWASRSLNIWRVSVVLSASVLWVMISHMVGVIVWAVVFDVADVFADFGESYYFCLVAYTTLGFGDLILPEPWRILAGVIAANGFLLFGWSTAFQVELLADLRKSTAPNL